MNKSFEIGTLLLRVVTGIIFFVHGLSKFTAMEGTIQFFGSIGLPSFMAYVIAAIELVGGVLVFFGLATRIVGVLFALTLLGAIFTVKLKAPFMGNSEFDYLLLVASIHLALSGSRFLALDSFVFKAKKEENVSA
ncbi:DoxX family protein [Bacillus atrophaeus]|uniref:DoxX family protein n=1 Tax=Bacillus atrophaeus TaxID=1452 RepID=UPI00077AC990|nr:DoxX family protein [Bacillus atrophaeus]KXZ16464.1 oxidoreductase [Bacillus atrophaeus]MCY8466372.1 DoxX family protein [Bacillus atrophaeus]MCY8479520.1 DoxX family protein [Bacillus atrophaeus]MCY8486810.1 DoxX family protein [Bacillus atrophaeus]MCY8514848.1 DoxX family protein [Bacillus atrophaeus]